MKKAYAPFMAALLLTTGWAGSVRLAYAQLPNTNMGRFVHQPGDNQYTLNEQVKRHGDTGYIDTGGGQQVIIRRPQAPAASSGGGGGGGGGGVQPMASVSVLMGGSVGPRTDVSLEPISADEPIAPNGFPPLPERLDLPIAPAAGWGKALTRGDIGPAGGGGGGGRGGPPQMQGVHEHYTHYAPGAFQGGGGGGGGGGGDGGGGGGGMAPVGDFGQGNGGGGGGAASVPQDGGSAIGGAGGGTRVINNSGKGVGYYKCGEAAPPTVNRNFQSGDTFHSGGSAPPQYRGASSKQLKDLGMAPGLDERQDKAGAPDAPQAATINQTTTQDLSVPDDEAVSRYGVHDNAGKRFAKAVGRSAGRTGRNILNRGSMGLIGY